MERDKRLPYIKERLLFGPHTCRIGLCGQDGNCALQMPGVTTVGEKVWTTIYLCEAHANEHIERHLPKRKRKTNVTKT